MNSAFLGEFITVGSSLDWGIAVKIKVNGGSSLDYLLKLVDTVMLK